MTVPLVIDIYYGDNASDGRRPIDWAAVKAFGIVGCIHKATEGMGFVDPLYASRRKQAVAAGLKWGAYCFYHGGGALEADRFLSVAEPDNDLLVSLDWENLPGGGAPSATSARAFLDRIQDRLGRRAVIYSGNVAKEQIRGNDPYFAAHRLWLAQYGTTFKVQESWTTPWLWQQNGDSFGPGPHNIPGIKGLCDNNTIVDPMTQNQLLVEWSAPTGIAPVPHPAVAHDIRWLQSMLKAAGKYTGPIDGSVGPLTDAAMIAYVESHEPA